MICEKCGKAAERFTEEIDKITKMPGRHQKMSQEIVISNKLKKQFDEEVNQIQILEEAQGII